MGVPLLCMGVLFQCKGVPSIVWVYPSLRAGIKGDRMLLLISVGICYLIVQTPFAWGTWSILYLEFNFQILNFRHIQIWNVYDSWNTGAIIQLYPNLFWNLVCYEFFKTASVRKIFITWHTERIESCLVALFWFWGKMRTELFEPRHEKTCLCHMRTTKAQLRLRGSQPVHPRSLISTFIVHSLDNISLVSISKISSL